MHRAPRSSLIVALVFGLALVALPAVPPAQASDCFPAGGVDIGWAQPSQAGDFHILGRGWGHGVGMSQHGAQGAARLGCTVAEILGTYYPGTQITQRADRTIRVGLFRQTATTPLPSFTFVRAVAGQVRWTFNGSAPDGPGDQPAGDEAWTVRVQDGRLAVPNANWTAPAPGGRLEVDLDATAATRVQLPTKANQVYNRGMLRFEVTGDRMYVTVTLGSMEHYLYGLDEVPSSWPPAALQAQVITGRGYAHTRTSTRQDCGCQILDSVADQVYRGFTKEGQAGYGHLWVAAVDATAGRVLTYDGQIGSTFYSSSHGGQSERAGFSSFFSAAGDQPYLRPVDDSRWESASDSDRNGVRRWALTYSREQVSQRLASHGVGTVQSIHVRAPTGAGERVGNPDRTVPGGGGARYGGVEVIGTSGTARLSGLQFVQALGVPRRSELFRVEAGVQCLPTAGQDANQVVRRSAGQHRVATAAAVSGDHWEDASDVVLATSITFPDALSAGALAARLDAPILLTRGSQLDGDALRELERLGPERVHLMGGTAALSVRVHEQVEAAGFEVIRVAGPNRFATARAAALAAGASETGEVALAFGGDWPDAVSAGALSGSPDRVPVLLSQRDGVPEETLDALEELEAERVLLIGGTAVLTQAVADQLEGEGYQVDRLSGPSRYETSLAVAGNAAARADGDRPVVFATGQQFPDALSAGGLVARIGAGLVLTTRCDMREQIRQTYDHIEAGPYDAGVIVGGLAAVSDLVREQATTAITNGS